MAGREDLDRAGDRERLLLRLRVPGGDVSISEEDFPAIEERMRAHVRRPSVRARRCHAGAGARALRGGGSGVQGRADRRPRAQGRRGRDGGREAGPLRNGLAVHERPVHRPLPGPARAHDEERRRVQADFGRRRLLARGLDKDDADADLRDGVLYKGPAGGVSRARRAGEGTRPPQARERARPVHVLRRLARRRLLAAAGRGDLEPARRGLARDGPRARLRQR